MTRALWTAILGGTLVLTALAFGPTPLLVPGVGLLVLGAGAAGWVGVAARGRLERRLGSARVVEGESLTVELEARTPLAPPPGSELVDPLVGTGGRRLADPRRRTQCVTAEACFDRRGLVRAQPAHLVVRDPLDLARRELRSAEHELLVLPRVEPVTAVRRGRGRSPAPEAVRAAEGPETELDSLREAMPEAAATRIHWPALARTGTPYERTLLSESARRPLVVVDASQPSSADDLDRAVRAAASLCLWLARAGGCELLLPGDRRPAALDPGLGGWPSLHARLALLQPGGRPPAAERAGRGVVLWVAARPLARPPRGLVRAGADERLLVVPGPPPAGAAFAVAGCHARRLGRAPARAA